MLHDMYLLSCYFEPSQAMLMEDEFRKRYGDSVLHDAVEKGWLETVCIPCRRNEVRRNFLRLSQKGMAMVAKG